MTDHSNCPEEASRHHQTDDADHTEMLPDLDEWQTSPETRFEDIPGLTEEKQRLRQTVVSSMRPGRHLRTNTVFLYGQDEVGIVEIADALAQTLAEDGFDVFEVPLDNRLHREAHTPLAHYIEHARTVTPCVLVVRHISHANLDAESPTRIAIERVREEANRLVILATAPLWTEETRAIHESGFTDWFDICLDIDRPESTKHRAVVHSTLDSLCSDHAIDFDPSAIDFDTALDGLATGRSQILQTVAKRALIRAESDGATKCRTDHLAAAASNVAEEWSCQQHAHGYDQAEDEFTEQVTPSVPDVSFDDVGGLDEVKRRVRELLVYPREYGQLFERTGVTPAHGLLLHGPPGTGKTLLAKAVANATDRTFLAVQGPELKSMWFGQTEAQLREVFRRADEHAPSVVFFDELDAIAGTRSEFTHETNRSVVTTLLAELDGIEDRGDVLFMAATNRPEALDPAVTRAGRFGEAIEVPLPDRADRREIFAVHASDLPTTSSVTPQWFTDQVPAGVSGADIASICERSLYEAIRTTPDDADITISRRDVEAAIEAVTGSTDERATDPRAFE